MDADYSKENSTRNRVDIGTTEGRMRAFDGLWPTSYQDIPTVGSIFRSDSDEKTGGHFHSLTSEKQPSIVSDHYSWDLDPVDFGTAAIYPNEVMCLSPYLHGDHRLKPYSHYQDQPAGTIVYHTQERICTVRRGQQFGRKSGVYRSCCGEFVMKKRNSTDYLNRWKQLPGHDYVLPLLGVMTDGMNGFYEITNLMSGDLRMATGNVTLKQLAEVQTIDHWTHTWKNFSHIVRSILKGVIHFNNHGFQHYDLKEDNVFVGKPLGCMCESILTCTCREVWIIKIGDFDTLYGIKKPKSWYCGTKFYRPPESEEFYLRVCIPEYSSPVYDSWSIGVIILHLCCGMAIRKKVLNMPSVKYPECRYAKDLLLNQLVFGKTPRRLDPVVKFARSCIEVDFTRRPTPQELLEKWDQLCG